MKRLKNASIPGRVPLSGGMGGLIAILLLVQPAKADGHFAFDLEIELSVKAAAKLKTAREGITVLASYYGNPTSAAEQHTNDLGTIDLATETIEIPGAQGHVHVSGTKITAKKLGWLKGPAMVNVNVYSSRKSSEENLLNCDFIDTEVSKVARSPVTLRCSLIEEGLETLTKP